MTICRGAILIDPINRAESFPPGLHCSTITISITFTIPLIVSIVISIMISFVFSIIIIGLVINQTISLIDLIHFVREQIISN